MATLTDPTKNSATSDREIVIHRSVNAPRALVWAACTTPEHVDRWWGPNGFTNRTLHMDVRVGGEWEYTMRAPDGTLFPNLIVYKEVTPMDRLVYDHGDRKDPRQFEASITFTEQDGGTLITLRSIFPTKAARDLVVEKYGAIQGAEQTLARMAEHVAHMVPSPTADREIVLARVLDAPRKLAWRAMTDPQHVARWWGPNGFRTTITAMDLREGGTWQLTMHGPDGTNYPNKSIFQEIVPYERIVYALAGGREGGPGARFTATWTFEDVAGDRTRVTIHMAFASAEERDLVVREFGAIEGGRQTLARMDDVAAQLAATHGDLAFALPTDRSIELTRTFHAPRALVYRAWTEPAMMRRWFGGPPPFTTPVCEADVRPGGRWTLVMRDPDGVDYPLHGTYAEVVPGERLVMHGTLADHPAAFHAMLRSHFPEGHATPSPTFTWTVTFADAPGGTRLTMRMDLPDRTHRDAHIALGTETGWTAGMERLHDLLTSINP